MHRLVDRRRSALAEHAHEAPARVDLVADGMMRKRTPSRGPLRAGIPTPNRVAVGAGRVKARLLLEQIRGDQRALFEAMTTSFAALRRGLNDDRFTRVEKRLEDLEAAVRQNSLDIRKNSEDIRKNSEDIKRNSDDILRLSLELKEVREELHRLRRDWDRPEPRAGFGDAFRELA